MRDTGVGIAPDLLPHVFDVFVQGSITIDRAQGGLGIGLTLVRRLVELHGGSVNAHSDGAGTRQHLHDPPAARRSRRRPARRATASRHRQRQADRAADRRQRGRARNDGDHAGRVRLFGAAGRRRRAGRADGARAAPDVALVDIGLPGIDGYEVARRLRQDAGTRDIKLIALTGYGQADDQRRVLEAGFDVHLVKPVDIDHLLEAIGSCTQPVAAK